MSFYFNLISKEKKGLLYDFLRGCLWGMSLFYLSIIQIRKMLYRLGFFKQHKPQLFTICVGNLTAGGTGKTPFTIFLADQLCKSHKVAIAVRGYRSRGEHLRTPTHVDLNTTSEQVGDEALLIYKKVPDATILVSKHRTKSAELAAQERCTMLVLDDGLQHLAITPHFKIIMLDGSNPFGFDALLPRGLLREKIASLQTADLIVIHHAERSSHISQLEEMIRKYTHAPILHTSLTGSELVTQDGEIAKLPSKKVALFCGIAKPHSFLKTASQYGVEVVDTLFTKDHTSPSMEELERFWKRAEKKGASALICTEKDMVKLKPTHLPIYQLAAQLEITSGQEAFSNLLASWRASGAEKRFVGSFRNKE